MTDWRQHWNSAPARLPEGDYLKQVGKTVMGKAVPEASLDTMMADIARALELGPDDTVLDLCCGNGLLTSRCAKRCAKVMGVDFSEPLLAIARTRFGAPNVEYVFADVRDLPEPVLRERWSKIYMYEAIQHLAPGDVTALLESLAGSAASAAPIFFGSVPDRARIWQFYDTPERRAEYERRVRDGTEAIGHWWTQAELGEIGEAAGYDVEILAPSPSLHVAHYRLDALFRSRRAK